MSGPAMARAHRGWQALLPQSLRARLGTVGPKVTPQPVNTDLP